MAAHPAILVHAMNALEVKAPCSSIHYVVWGSSEDMEEQVASFIARVTDETVDYSWTPQKYTAKDEKLRRSMSPGCSRVVWYLGLILESIWHVEFSPDLSWNGIWMSKDTHDYRVREAQVVAMVCRRYDVFVLMVTAGDFERGLTPGQLGAHWFHYYCTNILQQ